MGSIIWKQIFDGKMTIISSSYIFKLEQPLAIGYYYPCYSIFITFNVVTSSCTIGAVADFDCSVAKTYR